MTSVETTETTQTTTQDPFKGAAVNALATVGFIALLILGITLAIYSSRYVPMAVTKLATLSNTTTNNNGNNTPTLSVVTATSTTTMLIPPPVSSSAMTASVASAPAATEKTSAPKTSHVRAPYGLPDLAVTIIATGYLSGPSTASFVPASIIPPGARPAVEFSIADDGTNVTGPWNFLAHIPSINNEIFNSPTEPSLNPGDHTVFTLGFNEAIPGPSQTITIVADPNNTIAESNKSNNTASAAVTITQTGN